MIKNYFKIFYSNCAGSELCNINNIARPGSILLILFFIAFMSLSAQSQQATAQLLKEPATWSFERFALPPSFAPNFSYKGVEELRFSPGMFQKEATDYFTYAFVAQLDNVKTITRDNIQNYLLEYFRGLCSSTAHDRKLTVDTSKITVNTEPQKGITGNEIIYNAFLNVFGVFADGAPVKLNMEVKVLKDVASVKTYLVFIASPQEKTSEVWKDLYKIQNDFKIPAN